ncbi:MAG: tetratricopeptide repeat protein [Thermodesulfovibrionales bacterium]|nr:tetratricopeptide repeat protein [Thermodesulfovibrionales bacterium]
MALEDIERLKEKISRDPNSKLFVPLAEEYKKAGMYDEAIDALTKGLEQQPGYLSARVSLGKIYIERGMLVEARDEFEKVISAIPDNLYAHKKLAEIYRELGEKEKAVQKFRKVLKLNPMDNWAATSLAELQKDQEPEIPAAPIGDAEVPHPEEPPAEEVHEEPVPAAELPSESPAYGDKDLWDIPPEIEDELEEEQPPEIPLTAKDLEITETLVKEEEMHEEKPGEISGDEDAEDLTAVSTEIAGEISEEEGWDKVHEESPEEEEEIDLWKEPSGEGEELPGADETAETPMSREDLELWKSLKEAEDASDEPVLEAIETEEESFSFDDILQEAEPAGAITDTAVEEEERVPEEAGDMISEADRSVRDEKYTQALSIYRKILASEPDNRKALQRVEELKALLKLLGKDKEELIERLENLLKGIKKRRDEFSGTA